MTSSIEQTLKLIQLTLEKVTLTGENVGKITADSSQLGEHIQVIDTAIKEVEIPTASWFPTWKTLLIL